MVINIFNSHEDLCWKEDLNEECLSKVTESDKTQIANDTMSDLRLKCIASNLQWFMEQNEEMSYCMAN